nr:RES family NAD+ phosphorylase [Roseibium polysiphoniae]
MRVLNGQLVKIALAQEHDKVLRRGELERPAARFNRKGQDALYLSPDELSARVAIGQYVTPETSERVLLTFDLSDCRLCDLRHPDAAELYELARQPWIAPLEAGATPPSWSAADEIRKAGFDGLIDPSRRRPGLWHVTLFRWNEGDGPKVRSIGSPKPIRLTCDFS